MNFNTYQCLLFRFLSFSNLLIQKDIRIADRLVRLRLKYDSFPTDDRSDFGNDPPLWWFQRLINSDILMFINIGKRYRRRRLVDGCLWEQQKGRVWLVPPTMFSNQKMLFNSFPPPCLLCFYFLFCFVSLYTFNHYSLYPFLMSLFSFDRDS